MIQTFSSTIRRKEMDAVLTCMVDEKIGPGEINARFIQSVKEFFGCAGALAFRSPDTALKIALDLTLNKAVTKVYYPGLKSHPGFEINQKQAKNGGAMISFLLDDKHDVRKFYASLKLITLAESLGGVESLITYPTTQTHADIPQEVRESYGLTPDLLRIAVGIEHIDDLVADLDQALSKLL